MRAREKKLTVRVPMEQYVRIKAAAEGLDVSLNAYVISCALTDLDDRDATDRITALLGDHADAMEAAMGALSERLQADISAQNDRVKGWLQKIIQWQESHAAQGVKPC